MSLRDDIDAKIYTPQLCKLGYLRYEASPSDQQDIDDAVDLVRSDKASIAWLVHTLNNNGYPVGKTVVREHVREECRCVTE